MSAPSSYKPSDMIQSMEVKISTFTQQFTQTQIDSLQLGRKNEIRLTNQAMINHLRNSNLSSLTPSIEITPKYTTLNQQTSGLGGQPPAIANAGAITSSKAPFGIFPNLYNTSTTISQYTYNGQTNTFNTTPTLAIDALGNYVCLGANYDLNSATNYIELYVFNPVTSVSQSSLTCIKYTSYSQYNLHNNINNSYVDGISKLFVPMIVVRTDGNYVITVLDINNNVNFCLIDGSQTPTWGTIKQTLLIGSFNSYIPFSICTDYYENLYVVEGLSNTIYCYNSTGTQIAKSSNSIIDQNNNPVQSPISYFNFGYDQPEGTGAGQVLIAAAPSGEITVCDYKNSRIVSFTVDKSTQGIQLSSVNSIDLTALQQSENGYMGIAFDAKGLFIIPSTIVNNVITGVALSNLLIYNDQNLTTNNEVLSKNTSIDISNSTNYIGNFSIDSNGNFIMGVYVWDNYDIKSTGIQVFFSNPS